MYKSYLLPLTILLLCLSVLPAFSEGWVYGQFNTWYEKGDGSRLSNGKYTIDGEDYIFDMEGNRVFNQWTILTDGERYYSLSDGKVAKNQWISDTFYVDDTGAMVRDRWYNGNYFDIDGFLSVPQNSLLSRPFLKNQLFSRQSRISTVFFPSLRLLLQNCPFLRIPLF